MDFLRWRLNKPIHVESNSDLLVDIDDLEKKLMKHLDCRHLLISHMRGRVGDMDAVVHLCERFGVTLLEDCAHSLGVMYRTKHTGHAGVGCAISCQSYKLLNSGEGGFVLTNHPDVAARVAVYSGAYEEHAPTQHGAVPGPEYFYKLSQQLPNYSLRMTNLAAAVLRPQIHTLDERISEYNRRYYQLVQTLESRVGTHVLLPKITSGVSRMVHDSLQFQLNHETFSTLDTIQDFVNECHLHGLVGMERFGHPMNARNFETWGFAPIIDPLPMTRQTISRAFDIRLPLMWNDNDLNDLANVICESIESVLQRRPNQNNH